ncbi:MAG: TraR/DksA family transcriptional regulator [Betaproteobacteria bacterium]
MNYHYFTIEQRSALERAMRTQLAGAELNLALERLRSPEYGVCEACGADISYIRLAGNPILRRCAGCETRR